MHERDYVLKLVRLMQNWRYDPTLGVWKHINHHDVSVSHELLAMLLIHTLAAVDELEKSMDNVDG